MKVPSHLPVCFFLNLLEVLSLLQLTKNQISFSLLLENWGNNELIVYLCFRLPKFQRNRSQYDLA